MQKKRFAKDTTMYDVQWTIILRKHKLFFLSFFYGFNWWPSTAKINCLPWANTKWPKSTLCALDEFSISGRTLSFTSQLGYLLDIARGTPAVRRMEGCLCTLGGGLAAYPIMHKHVQTCTNMYKHAQSCTNMHNHAQSCVFQSKDTRVNALMQ